MTLTALLDIQHLKESDEQSVDHLVSLLRTYRKQELTASDVQTIHEYGLPLTFRGELPYSSPYEMIYGLFIARTNSGDPLRLIIEGRTASRSSEHIDVLTPRKPSSKAVYAGIYREDFKGDSPKWNSLYTNTPWHALGRSINECLLYAIDR